jgi:hypothetical protein
MDSKDWWFAKSNPTIIVCQKLNDSIYIVLDRIDKNFALTESSLQAGKY